MITTEAQKRAAERITEAMISHTQNHGASISYAETEDYGKAHGTGTYLRLRDKPYLLTNEHVARKRLDGKSLVHNLKSGENSWRLVEAFQAKAFPYDLALTRIDAATFDEGEKMTVAVQQLAMTSEGVCTEPLFISGFPGAYAYFSALGKQLNTKPLQYLTAEKELPKKGFDPKMHFAVHYLPQSYSKGGKVADLPLPGGLSGSAIWNTRVNEIGLDNWSPTDSRICGIAFAWDQDEQVIIATRIECVRYFLVEALRHEAAFFRWNDNLRPQNTALSDWLWAEAAVSSVS